MAHGVVANPMAWYISEKLAVVGIRWPRGTWSRWSLASRDMVPRPLVATADGRFVEPS